MVAVCLYFQVHQPYRLSRYRIFDIGNHSNYFDDNLNKEVFQKVAARCYLPANEILLKAIQKTGGKFKVAFSISGVALEQMEKYAPNVLESFKELARTGCVEFLSETYYHSLSFLYSKEEFKRQIELHRRMIEKHFGQNPKVFRNTELVYTNELAPFIEELGYKAIFAEGAESVLGWRSPNHLYEPLHTKNMSLFLKNSPLSDDIAFRFSDRRWVQWPLTAKKYSKWIDNLNSTSEIVNLFMDYETFGEHHWKENGIFDFLSEFPYEMLKGDKNIFVTPSEAIDMFPSRSRVDVPFVTSWADKDRDLGAWLGNKMQQEAIKDIFQLETIIRKLKSKELLEDWRKLTISDHYYYMSTKKSEDGAIHSYFSIYESPYDAYVFFMNALNDLLLRIRIEDEKQNGGKNSGKKSLFDSILGEVQSAIKS